MLTGRAYAVLAAGVLLWVASRILGSSDLHMVAAGLMALVPLAALLVRVTRPVLVATRRLSTRRAFPGTRVSVDVEVQNTGSRRTPMLLIEDVVPPVLGSPARGVLGEVRPRTRATYTYSLVPRTRGRYTIGPLRVWATDPFDLVRRRVELDLRHDLVVFPEVEDLGRSPVAAPVGGSGESSTRQLFRSGADFYTMRAYEEGDDLRRIHWPSVARTGELMIRQDEASRRAAASVFVDTRVSALGRSREAFERGVSVAASVGALYLRAGYRLRLATPDGEPVTVDHDTFLERLAVAKASRTAQVGRPLDRLASSAAGGGALVVVTHVPTAPETAAMTRVAPAAGSKLAVLVTPRHPGDPTTRPRHELDRSLEGARGSLIRSGWDVLVLSPEGRLRDVWPQRWNRRAIAASS